MLTTFIRAHPGLRVVARFVRRAVESVLAPDITLFTLYYRLRLRKCGRRVAFSTTMIIRNPQNIEIGDDCSFSHFVILDAHDRITIGSQCMFANNVVISTATHDENINPMNSVMLSRPVTIGNNVWMGVGATVLPGLSVGDGAIIGARALATRDVPPGAVVVGVPGRIVRFRGLAGTAPEQAAVGGEKE